MLQDQAAGLAGEPRGGSQRVDSPVEWFSRVLCRAPERGRIVEQGLTGLCVVEPPEVIQFSAQCGRLFQVGESLHDQYRQGRFDPKTWRCGRRGLTGTATNLSYSRSRGSTRQNLNECTPHE